MKPTTNSPAGSAFRRLGPRSWSGLGTRARGCPHPHPLTGADRRAGEEAEHGCRRAATPTRVSRSEPHRATCPCFPGLAPSQGLRAVPRTSDPPAAPSTRSNRVRAALEKGTPAAAPALAGPPLPPARSAERVDPPGSRAPSCRRAERRGGGRKGCRRGGCALAGRAALPWIRMTYKSHRTVDIAEKSASLQTGNPEC